MNEKGTHDQNQAGPLEIELRKLQGRWVIIQLKDGSTINVFLNSIARKAYSEKESFVVYRESNLASSRTLDISEIKDVTADPKKADKDRGKSWNEESPTTATVLKTRRQT